MTFFIDQYGLDALKWGTDWIIKAHTGPNEVYAQVCKYLFKWVGFW